MMVSLARTADRASFSCSFSGSFSGSGRRNTERLIVPPRKARDETEPQSALRPSLRPSLRRMPRLVLHAFVTDSNGLVHGDEIRKECLHAGAGAEIEQASEARSNDCRKQNYDNCSSKNQ